MPCAFCGEGDMWIKTCRTGDRCCIRVCDPCWEILGVWLVVVPGEMVVTARCDVCGAYFSPREMVKVSPGGRYNANSGTCGACAEEGSRGSLEEKTTRKERNDREADFDHIRHYKGKRLW